MIYVTGHILLILSSPVIKEKGNHAKG